MAQESAKGAIAAATPFNSDGTPRTADYAGAAQAYFAQAKTQGLLQYLPGTATLTSNGLTSVPGGTGEAFTVTVSITGLTGPGRAFPTMSLGIMGLSDVPPLPSTLSASAHGPRVLSGQSGICHCEAYQRPRNPEVGAATLDCFAALAMTNTEKASDRPHGAGCRMTVVYNSAILREPSES